MELAAGPMNVQSPTVAPGRMHGACSCSAEPDKFLAELIIEHPLEVVSVFRHMRERFKKPPMSVDNFFDSLARHRLDLIYKYLERYRDLL